MATSTTVSVWRSSGGDQTKTAYAGQMPMVASFYASTTGTTAATIQKSSTNTSRIILPQNAIVLSILLTVDNTGGSSSTISIGYTGLTSGTTYTGASGIVNGKSITSGGTPSTTNLFLNVSDAAFVKTVLGTLSTTELVYLTAVGGGTTPGNNVITGVIQYIVSDNGAFTA